MAVTIHLWSEDDQALKSFVLDCPRITGRHTADVLGEELAKVLEKNQVQSKVLAGVTDNGANIVKALDKIQIRQVSCYAHTLTFILLLRSQLRAILQYRAFDCAAHAAQMSGNQHGKHVSFLAESIAPSVVTFLLV